VPAGGRRAQNRLEVVAVNDITDAGTLATLLEWDSISESLQGYRVGLLQPVGGVLRARGNSRRLVIR